MLLATTLHQGVDAFTGWMDSPELNAFISLQLLAVSATDVDIEFQVYHRNHDESGEGAPYGTAKTIDSSAQALPFIDTISATGLKQQWRVRVKVKDGAGGNTEWAMFQFPNPSFYASAS